MSATWSVAAMSWGRRRAASAAMHIAAMAWLRCSLCGGVGVDFLAPGGISPGGVLPGGVVPGGVVPGGIAPGSVAPKGVAGSACDSPLMRGPMTIDGMPPTYLAGENGSASGDEVVIRHHAGMSVFSACEQEWEPRSIAQFDLLGRTFSFRVDLSEVGCACNVAVYLISSPAIGKSGEFSAGKDRGDQPPFYCDANKVGGQWCPEVDIMEANNHAFQATAHKCNSPVNGHYDGCDRGGCYENTRDREGSYGPDSTYTIDTRHPFEVETAFPEQDGILLGMVTTLRQEGREVVMDHDGCEQGYLNKLSAAMQQGMSLRITYWGDDNATMAWMDAPPCGYADCGGENAGQARFRSFAVSPRHDLSYYRLHGFRPAKEGPELHWLPKVDSPWQCHWYTGRQQDTLWCAYAGIQGGFEYKYNDGMQSPCGGCGCCKRQAIKIPVAPGALAERVWIVNGAGDDLFGQVVPSEVIHDPSRFVQEDERGVVSWRGAKHFVRQVVRGELPEAESAELGDTGLEREDLSVHMLMKKFVEGLPSVMQRPWGREALVTNVTAVVACGFLVGVAMIAMGRRYATKCRRSAADQQASVPEESESSQLLATAAASAEANELFNWRGATWWPSAAMAAEPEGRTQ
mmetsp:Transcript_129330/g.374516  ORF Transcript_129330/g.374516 Transcript_129330/m.374516 type:complete len:630 (-) Transcript_129330:116-2005(-)